MKEYIEEKIKVLHQLGIFLMPDEKKHLWSLKTEIAVDAYARTLIKGNRIRISSIVKHKRHKDVRGVVVRQSIEKDGCVTVRILPNEKIKDKLLNDYIENWELYDNPT